MVKAKAIKTFRNKNNAIVGYCLADVRGNLRNVSSSELKSAIKAGKIKVVNLTLTKDNRLVQTSVKSSKSSSGKQAVKVGVKSGRIENRSAQISAKSMKLSSGRLDVEVENSNQANKKVPSSNDIFDIVSDGGEVVLKGVKSRSDLKKIRIPDGVTALEDCCFKGFENLESISIPSSVKVIGATCFKDCKSLKSIVIPESVEYIGHRDNYKDRSHIAENGCFEGCTSLVHVKVCNPEIAICDFDTFAGCTSLKNIEYHKDYTGSLDSTFCGCTSLEHIDLPDGVLINPYSFSGCTALKSIKIPRGTDYLGDGAFKGCTSLESIILSDTCTACDGECFGGCKSLKSIYIPDSVTFIGGLEDSPNVVVTCNPNSYAEEYCKENNINYKYR